MRCSKHPEHEAAGICAHSGKAYCADELVEVEGRLYGRDNLSAVFAAAKATTAAPPPTQVFMNAGGASSSSSSAAAAVGGGYGRGHVRRYSRTLAILLCLLGLTGIGGLHRLYTGHTTVGVIQLLTIGGFFIWQLADLIALMSGTYRDAWGHTLTS